MSAVDRILSEIRAAYALEDALKAGPSAEARPRRVTAFWFRLGDPKPREAALDTLARALALGISVVE